MYCAAHSLSDVLVISLCLVIIVQCLLFGKGLGTRDLQTFGYQMELYWTKKRVPTSNSERWSGFPSCMSGVDEYLAENYTVLD